ncbi:hypothetical protein V2W45_1307553 [Cenococcum geophilum]
MAKFHSSLLNAEGYFSFPADTSDLLQHAWCAFVEPTMMRRLLARRSKESDSNDKAPSPSASTTPPPRRKTFPSGIKLVHSVEGSVVDIVFVHGLTGDREKTWTAKNATAPWPQILLPSKIPNARVLTFGYDAYVADWRGMVSKNRIGNHSWNLLTALTTYREDDNTDDRPIIFVCHSLGGLVCEDALSTARQRPERHLRKVLHCTRGILFLGTPHHGSGLAQWAERLAKAIGLLKQTNPQILAVLESDSEVLARIQDSFHAMIRLRTQDGLPPIEITCFFEELPLPVVGIVVPSHSAVLPGYTPIGIRSNHMDMTKFEDTSDPGFTAVAGELRRWVRELVAPSDARAVAAATPQEEQEGQRHDELFAVPYISNPGFVGRSATLGDAHGITINSKAVNQPNYVDLYANKSLRPVSIYVARPALHKQIKEQLHDTIQEEGPASKILVVYGLGGAGKSQLVLNYIQTYRQDYSAVFWVDAGLKESVERDYLQIYSLLLGFGQAPEPDKISFNDAVLAVKSWFYRRGGRWLFVLDSADTIDNDQDQNFIDLSRYLPDAPCIDIIITTRSLTARDMTELEPVEVGELEPSEATELFLCCSKLKNPAPEVTVEAALIAKELGYLALAVTLAGAYVAATPRISSDIRQYLPEYQWRRKTLLSRKANPYIHQYGESVLSTWETSFVALASKSPEAARLLSFLAFLSPDDIFLGLFDALPGRGTEWELAISPEAPLEDVLDVAFETLTTYSLIQWKEDQGSYFMHKLVHAWGHDRLKIEEQVEYGYGALKLLAGATSRCELDPAAKARIAPHIAASFARLCERYRSMDSGRVEALTFLRSLADFIRETGRWDAEYELRLFEYEGFGQLAKTENLAWLRSMSNLASVLQDQWKYEEAEEMNQRALEGREKALGKEHPSTLASVNNLALVLGYQGKYEKAEEMNRQALEGYEKALGKEHPDTLTSVGNLASVLRDQGRYKEAEEINRRALEGRGKAMGKEHPDTLTSVNNLASVLGYQGKYEEAEEMNQRALEGREKALGEEHPSTLTSVSNLALVLQDQGKYKEAEQINRRALEGYKKALGKEHPDTLTSVDNLALVLGYQGKYKEAEQINQRALEGIEKALGKEHPSTLTSVSNLALVLRD